MPHDADWSSYAECEHASWLSATSWLSVTAVFVGAAVLGGLAGWIGALGALYYLTN